MRRVVKIFNLKVDESRMPCVSKNSAGGNFHRKYNDKQKIYKDALTEQMKIDTFESMKIISEILREHGQDPVPWKKWPQEILPKSVIAT